MCTVTSRRVGCECMLEIDTVFGVQWCVVGTRLLINNAFGVGLGGLG